MTRKVKKEKKAKGKKIQKIKKLPYNGNNEHFSVNKWEITNWKQKIGVLFLFLNKIRSKCSYKFNKNGKKQMLGRTEGRADWSSPAFWMIETADYVTD